MSAYVIEVELPGGGAGYLAPLTHQLRPAYTPHLRHAARFASARAAADASRGVPPCYEPTVVKLAGNAT